MKVKLIHLQQIFCQHVVESLWTVFSILLSPFQEQFVAGGRKKLVVVRVYVCVCVCWGGGFLLSSINFL